MVRGDAMAEEAEAPQEGVDYVFDERGLMVFTAAYHLKRGYCCENGCRNCPYSGAPEPLEVIQ